MPRVPGFVLIESFECNQSGSEAFAPFPKLQSPPLKSPTNNAKTEPGLLGRGECRRPKHARLPEVGEDYNFREPGDPAMRRQDYTRRKNVRARSLGSSKLCSKQEAKQPENDSQEATPSVD